MKLWKNCNFLLKWWFLVIVFVLKSASSARRFGVCIVCISLVRWRCLLWLCLSNLMYFMRSLLVLRLKCL